MVVCDLPKVETRVRFPYPALKIYAEIRPSPPKVRPKADIMADPPQWPFRPLGGPRLRHGSDSRIPLQKIESDNLKS